MVGVRWERGLQQGDPLGPLVIKLVRVFAEDRVVRTGFPEGFLVRREGDPPFRFASIDLETTGFGRQARIIEVGIVTHENSGGVSRHTLVSSLINPLAPGELVSAHPQVWRVNGIDPKWLMSAPPLERVFPLIATSLSGRWVIGHNIGGFDLPLLERQANEWGGSLTRLGVFDTRRLSKRLLGVGSLSEVAQRCGLPPPPHRAVQDAWTALSAMTVMLAGRPVDEVLPGFGLWEAGSGVSWFDAPIDLLTSCVPKSNFWIPGSLMQRREYMVNGRFAVIPHPRPGYEAIVTKREPMVDSPYRLVLQSQVEPPRGY